MTTSAAAAAPVCPFDLGGRVALVTGGARGLGFAMAQALAAAGATVILADIDEAAATASAQWIGMTGGQAKAVELDVASEEATALAFRSVEADHGRLDILVNNAGIALYGGVEDHPLADWRRVIDVDLTALYAVSRAACPLMKATGYGRIVNIASVLGLTARPGIVSYVAAKHGVIGLTRSLAAELGRYRITCNAIAPGYFHTPMGDELSRDSAFEAMISGRTPLGRWGEPADLGGAVVFLASPASAFVTGHVLTVDGGLTASLFQPEAFQADGNPL